VVLLVFTITLIFAITINSGDSADDNGGDDKGSGCIEVGVIGRTMEGGTHKEKNR